MPESQNVDERSRLLPAIPHRSYVYADELVQNKTTKEITGAILLMECRFIYDYRVPFSSQR